MMHEHGTLDLHIESTGTGEPKVVFVHGGAADLRIWERVVPLIAPSRRCILYDRRGLGRSSAATAGPSHTDDLRRLLEDHTGPAIVLGSSIGAATALDAAIQRPELVLALVLIGPLLIGHSLSRATLERVAELRRAAEDGGEALANAFLADRHLIGSSPLIERSLEPGLERCLEPGLAPYLQHLRAIVADNKHAWTQRAIAASPRSVLGKLDQVEAPTQVLVGSDDDPDNLVMAKMVARDIRRATLRIIEGAGHLLEIVKPEEVARRVLEN